MTTREEIIEELDAGRPKDIRDLEERVRSLEEKYLDKAYPWYVHQLTVARNEIVTLRETCAEYIKEVATLRARIAELEIKLKPRIW